jgi:hypothetical protein
VVVVVVEAEEEEQDGVVGEVIGAFVEPVSIHILGVRLL